MRSENEERTAEIKMKKALKVLGLTEKSTLNDAGDSFRRGFDKYLGGIGNDATNASVKVESSWQEALLESIPSSAHQRLFS